MVFAKEWIASSRDLISAVIEDGDIWVAGKSQETGSSFLALPIIKP
jgi:hypothetical protein